MTITRKIYLAVVLAVTVGACASPGALLSSLRGSDVGAADASPAVLAYAGQKPGQLVLIERTFAQQPPLIPHSVDGYEEITATENACIDCHISDDFRGKKMPPVSRTHLAKASSAGADPVLDMTRWQCNSCHVPQVDAKPLVENDFVGLAVKR